MDFFSIYSRHYFSKNCYCQYFLFYSQVLSFNIFNVNMNFTEYFFLQHFLIILRRQTNVNKHSSQYIRIRITLNIIGTKFFVLNVNKLYTNSYIIIIKYLFGLIFDQFFSLFIFILFNSKILKITCVMKFL